MVRRARRAAHDCAALDALPLIGHTLEALEAEALRQTIALEAGDLVAAARVLGISVAALKAKAKKHGLALSAPKKR